MTASEAITYINTHTWNLSKPGLERSFELLQRLGDPQKKLRFIHVAGTNGKGSTCAMLSSILREAGLKVGLYPSPYLEEFRERIQIDGAYIPEEALAAYTSIVAEAADQMADHPTQFELITAIGLLYFAEEGCDMVVLEAGMGGALDSTNVIDAPEVAILTNIGLDHTEFLGETITAITETKCGIIKPGCAAVTYDSVPEALDVIERICEEKQVPLYRASDISLTPVSRDLSGQVFMWEKPVSRDLGGQRFIWEQDEAAGGSQTTVGADGEAPDPAAREEGKSLRLTLPLLGAHQLENVRTVLAAVTALRARGYEITDEHIQRGLAKVSWPARFEVLRYDPVFILDAGHNPQCAGAVAAGIHDYLPGQKVTFLIGMLRDKDVASALEYLYPYAERFLCVTPESTRALPAEDLAEMIRAAGYEAEAFETVPSGVDAALEAGPAVAFGSFYMAGHVRSYYRRRTNAGKCLYAK